MEELKLIEATPDRKNGFCHWLGTWYEFPQDWESCLTRSGRFASGQIEKCPRTDRLHVQFYVYTPGSRTLESMRKKIPGAHLIGISNLDAEKVYRYSIKERSRVGGTFEKGDKPQFRKCKNNRYEETLKLCKLNTWENVDAEHQVKYFPTLTKLAAHYSEPIGTDSVRGLWIYGETGVGKSHAARHNYGNSYYVKAQNKWWDNYRGESVVILDDFDHQGACLSHHIKIWADKYPTKGEIKHGSVALNYQRFIITSQYLPEDIWPGESNDKLRDAIRRRFEFLHLTKENEVEFNINRVF